jgi:hypothetical protein
MGMTKMSYPNANGHAFKPSKRDPKLCAAVIGGFICAHKADHPRHAAEPPLSYGRSGPTFPRHLLQAGGTARCGEMRPTHTTRVPSKVKCPACIAQFTPDEARYALNGKLSKAFDTLANTPAEARTGISDQTAAALADVAELRMMISLHMNAASSLQVEARERLDRIEQALRQR